MDQADAWRAFAFYSTNLSHLLPELPLKQHAAHFEETQRLRQLNTLEHSYRQLENHEPTESGMAGITAPAIVATFHTGPYHLVCGWLMQRRIPFSLVLAAEAMQARAANYRRLYRHVTGQPATAGDFGIINASDPHSLLYMRTALRNGQLLVLYVDGNMGAGNPNGRQPQLALDFLAGTLRVKTGAAYLSYLMQCPVYPVLCRWQQERAVWHSARPLTPRSGEPRAAYIRRCMAGVYGVLAETLRRDAPQWEGWGYVHHDLEVAADGMDMDQPATDKLVDHFIPIRFGGLPYLLHRHTLLAYPISDAQHEKLWDFAKKIFIF